MLHVCMCVYVCAACVCMCVRLCCVCNSANAQCVSCQGMQSIASGWYLCVLHVYACVYVCACVFVCVPASLLLTTARRVFSSVCVFVCGWLLSRAGRWHQVCDGLWWAVQLSQRVVRILPRHAWHRFVCVCVCVCCVCVCVCSSAHPHGHVPRRLASARVVRNDRRATIAGGTYNVITGVGSYVDLILRASGSAQRPIGVGVAVDLLVFG